MTERRVTRLSNSPAEKWRRQLYDSESETEVSDEVDGPLENVVVVEELSVQDTEPLDTEPIVLEEEEEEESDKEDVEEALGEEESGEEEEAGFSGASTCASNDASAAEGEEEEEVTMKNHKRNDSFSSGNSSDLNLDFDDFPAPPPLDLNIASSEDVRRVYTELINSMHECEKPGKSRAQVDKILLDNILKGQALMRRMGDSLSQSSTVTSEEEGSQTPRGMLGQVATELLLACEHTKLCAAQVKARALELGEEKADFGLDEFMATLKRKHVDKKGNYSRISLVGVLSTAFFNLTIPVYPAPMMLGAVPHPEEVTVKSSDEPPSQKERKPRMSRKRGDHVDGPATQSEILNDGEEKEEDEEVAKEGAEVLAKDVLKGLKIKCQESGGKPQNLMEVAAEGGDTVNDVVSRLFGASFVVRDGRAALGSSEVEEGAVGVANLTLKPAKPKEGQARQQYITSFSAKFIKEMLRNGGTFPDFTAAPPAPSPPPSAEESEDDEEEEEEGEE